MPRQHKFERAPKAASQMAAEIIKKFHPELKAAGVRLDIVFCHAETDGSGQPKSFALQRKGHRLLGVASIVPLLDRAMGRGDAQVKIDADWWEKQETTDRQREALLDHELTHFEPKKDELGARMEDDLGRPRLQMRDHDWELSGFKVIADRWGADSVEVMEARALQERAGQILFEFAAA